MKILFLANWQRTRAKGGDYAFFEHYKERPELRVLTTFRIPLITWLERRVLKFYVLQALAAWWMSARFDLVIAYSSQCGLPLGMIRRILGTRGVPLVIHDIENFCRLTGIARRAAGFALKSAQRIVTPSSEQVGQYAGISDDAARKAVHIEIGIGPYEEAPALADALQDSRIAVIGKADQGPRFRDWHTLLQALVRVKRQYELLIIGRDALPEADRGGVELPERTRFVPYTPAARLVPVLGTCRLAVLPLPERGQSQGQLTALFCMACGRPLIATGVMGLGDYVEHERTGLLYKPGDADDLARSIERLLSDDELSLDLGRRAHDAVVERFTDRAMAQQWEELCREVVLKP